MLPYLSPHAKGVSLDLYVQPGAKRQGVVGEHNGRLKLAVTQIAEGGKANQAVVALIAKLLGISKSRIELLRGHHCREKTLFLEDGDIDAIEATLAKWLNDSAE